MAHLQQCRLRMCATFLGTMCGGGLLSAQGTRDHFRAGFPFLLQDILLNRPVLYSIYDVSASHSVSNYTGKSILRKWNYF